MGIVAMLTGCGGTSEPITPPTGATRLDLFLSAPAVAVGGVVEAAATLRDATGKALDGAAISWATGDGSIAAADIRGEILALRAGETDVLAKSGALSATARLVVRAPDTADPGSWTFCAKEGTTCDFFGLRAVRLGAANGPWVQQVAFHTVPCATYGFGGQNPAPGQPLHCDIGPVKTTVLNNPSPGMAGLGATVTVPLGSPGAEGQRVRATTDQPAVTDGSGSFRTTCGLASVAFDDPIVYPGRPGASHLHVFFGNVAARASSTPESVASSGNSSCLGGIVNRTAYWAPAVIDARSGEVQVPDDGIFYYKSGYNMTPAEIRPFPAGLRMIAGDRTATAAQANVGWSCRDHFTGSSATIPTNCPAGDFVRLEIDFPQCWDGVHLDSPDHHSHMAFPDYRNPPQRSSCPASHPVALPAITEKFDYPVSGHTPASWRLSSDMYGSSLAGGLSAHADWMNGWIPSFMQKIVTQCIARGVDCGVASLGDGTELY